MYGKDQFNLESYIHTTILFCAEEDRLKNKVTTVLQKEVHFPVQKKKASVLPKCLQKH